MICYRGAELIVERAFRVCRVVRRQSRKGHYDVDIVVGIMISRYVDELHIAHGFVN